MVQLITTQENHYDTATLCPYCGDMKNMASRGCCGESSAHFEEHFVIWTPTSGACRWSIEAFVNPKTGEQFDEPCDETRSES